MEPRDVPIEGNLPLKIRGQGLILGDVFNPDDAKIKIAGQACSSITARSDGDVDV